MHGSHIGRDARVEIESLQNLVIVLNLFRTGKHQLTTVVLKSKTVLSIY